jgi:hypothetical protein
LHVKALANPVDVLTVEVSKVWGQALSTGLGLRLDFPGRRSYLQVRLITCDLVSHYCPMQLPVDPRATALGDFLRRRVVEWSGTEPPSGTQANRDQLTEWVTSRHKAHSQAR